MANRTTLSKMLEHLVNDDQQTAEELFHEYVVAKSREIYENLLEAEFSDEDEDDNDEDEMDDIGGDPTDDLVSDLDSDDTDDMGMGDDDMGMGDDDMDIGDDDMDMGDREPEELFQDLTSIVDELQAKFDELGDTDDMGMGDDDMGMGDDDMDMGDDDMDTDTDMDMGDDDMDMGDDEEDDDDEIKDSFDRELATVREYVEKINAKMGDNGVNTKSIVAGKNDMGGTSANMTRCDTSETGGTKGGLAAPTTKEDNAGNVNVPGGKAGVKHLNKKPGHGAEKKATGDNGDGSASSLFHRKPRK